MKIAFLGTGIMGRPMAGHLIAGGHALFLARHRSPVPPELLAAGAVECASAAEAAAQAQVVILMVPDTPDVEALLFGADGLVPSGSLVAGDTLIDMSSIDPLATRAFAEKLAAIGVDYVDAPVSGGEIGAKNATLSIMCGAQEEVFVRMLPLLELMGKNIVRVGGIGDGQVAKVANQIVVALNIAAVAEALVFAAKAGADPAKVREALLGGFASSRVLEVHGERMIARKFDPGFRIPLHQKDLGIALAAARNLGMALPNTAATQQLFSVANRSGEGLDHSAIVKAIETLAGIELTARQG